MRIGQIMLVLILASQTAAATGIGVVPDRLLFDSDEKSFRILNPNEQPIEFIINSELECDPEEGDILPKSSAEIICRTNPEVPEISAIIVETAIQQQGSIGMMPAIAIGVQIQKDKTGISRKEEVTDPENATPLTVSGENQQQNNSIISVIKRMKPEIISIAILITAILAAITYPEIKKRITDACEPSPQAAPSCRSSASSEASPGQQKPTPLRDEKAENQPA